MKILLHSNHKWTEKSFPFILKQLNRAKGFDFATIDRVPAPKVFAPFVPQTNGFNYPDWNWFYETLSKPFETKYDLIVWHEERAFGQGLQTGAERLYNGVYDDQTKDTIFNCVVFAGNKATDRRTIAHHALYPGMTDFERIFIHEVSHGASRFKGVDLTHDWDYIKNNIPGAFDTYDLSLYKPQRTVISLLKQMLELLTKKKITKPTALTPLLRRKAEAVILDMKMLGHEIRLVQGFRSIAEQDRLYAQGRTTPGNIVTKAKGGESFHNYGCALDFTFRKHGNDAPKNLWETLGTIGKQHGLEWGGDWKRFVDRPHFQLTLGYSLSDFQKDKVDYSKYN